MKIGVKKTVDVELKTLRIHTKVCDSFQYTLEDAQGDEVHSQDDGYVPAFMPGDHYGDYIILDIDLETGRILNWKRPESVRDGVMAVLAEKGSA